jgi:hypothetical protein
MGRICRQRVDGSTTSYVGRIRRVDCRPTTPTVCIVIRRLGNFDRSTMYHQWCGDVCGALVERCDAGPTHGPFAARVESCCGNVQGATQGQCQGPREAELAARRLHVACHQGTGCPSRQMESRSRRCRTSRVVCGLVPTRNGRAPTTHTGNQPHGHRHCNVDASKTLQSVLCCVVLCCVVFCFC